jgi:hypothetical protein
MNLRHEIEGGDYPRITRMGANGGEVRGLRSENIVTRDCPRMARINSNGARGGKNLFVMTRVIRGESIRVLKSCPRITRMGANEDSCDSREME